MGPYAHTPDPDPAWAPDRHLDDFGDQGDYDAGSDMYAGTDNSDPEFYSDDPYGE